MEDKPFHESLPVASGEMNNKILYEDKKTDLDPQITQVSSGRSRGEILLTNFVPSVKIGGEFATMMASITLSDGDLDHLEALSRSSNSLSSLSELGQPQSKKKTYSAESRPCNRSTRPRMVTPPKHETITLRELERERAKADRWNEVREIWEEISPERGHRATRDGPGVFRPNERFNNRPETAWSDFAAARGGRVNTFEERQVPDPRETGGYMQDPNRDYSRPDGPVRLLSKPSLRGSRRQAKVNNHATFNPPSNLPRTRSSPGQQVYCLRRGGHIAYDAEEFGGESEVKRRAA